MDNEAGKKNKIVGITSITFFVLSLFGLLFMFYFVGLIADQPTEIEFGQNDREFNLQINPAVEEDSEVVIEVEGPSE